MKDKCEYHTNLAPNQGGATLLSNSSGEFLPARPGVTNQWLTAICPMCHRSFKYLEIYKPKTCGSYACLHQYLHPEIKGSRL